MPAASIQRPAFEDEWGSKTWLNSRGGPLMREDGRPMTIKEITQHTQPFTFSTSPSNYGGIPRGWLINEAPADHDTCISWNSGKVFSKWEFTRMHQRRNNEESLNLSLQMGLMEAHGGAVGTFGIKGLGDSITENDMMNRTWCKSCKDEIHSGRRAAASECDPLPGPTYKHIYYHYKTQRQSGPYDPRQHSLVPVCIKCQRDYLLQPLDDLMTNPLITALSEVITAQSGMTVAATAAMNRSIATTAAAVMAAPVTAVTAVMESGRASDE